LAGVYIKKTIDLCLEAVFLTFQGILEHLHKFQTFVDFW